MNAKATEDKPNGQTELKEGMIRRGWQLAVQFVIMGGILFLSAGTFRWPGAWVFLAVYVLGIAVNTVFLLRTNPGVIAERAQTREETKGWDRTITRVILYALIAAFIVAGLDWRFGWSTEIPNWLWLTSLALFVLGNAFASWAMIANTYFATTVAIQVDRGHQVVTGGPYRIMRHPGYCGWIVGYLFMPLLFGSYWGFIPIGLVAAVFIVRTALEDRTLRAELEGYEAYTGQVRYRLVPGVW